ncbi:MAG: hypothetical protein ACKOET_19615, partial [Verrucomicrobiota bacterium]
DGGAVGPDLTGIHHRRRMTEILESILQPSRVIAPEYAQTEIATASGETLVGRVESESAGRLVLRPAGADEPVEIPLGQVRSRRLHPVSNMPEGMLDALERPQVLDLLAFLANPANPANPVEAVRPGPSTGGPAGGR